MESGSRQPPSAGPPRASPAPRRGRSGSERSSRRLPAAAITSPSRTSDAPIGASPRSAASSASPSAEAHEADRPRQSRLNRVCTALLHARSINTSGPDTVLQGRDEATAGSKRFSLPWRASPSRRRPPMRAEPCLRARPGPDQVQGPAGGAHGEAARRGQRVRGRSQPAERNPGVAYANPNYLAGGRRAVESRTTRARRASDSTAGRTTSGTSSPRRSAPGGVERPGRLAEPDQHGEARRARGVTVAVLDTGVAYRSKGTNASARDPDLPPTRRFVAPKDFVDHDQLAARPGRPRDARREHDRPERPTTTGA